MGLKISASEVFWTLMKQSIVVTIWLYTVALVVVPGYMVCYDIRTFFIAAAMTHSSKTNCFFSIFIIFLTYLNF